MDPLLAPFAADPAGSAILLDIDGTLAPIVASPELAAVPAATLATLGELAARYGLVACLSGRGAADAARLVPVPRVAIVGNHGLERLVDGVVEVAPAAAPYRAAIVELAAEIAEDVARIGARLEDKGASLTFHVRGLPDPAAAGAALEELLRRRAGAAGLAVRTGRMVVEVLPPVAIDKGTAVRGLLAERPLSRSLYAGDDVTDLDAFREVDVRIAVASAEGPPALREAADRVVDDPPALAALLARL